VLAVHARHKGTWARADFRLWEWFDRKPRGDGIPLTMSGMCRSVGWRLTDKAVWGALPVRA